MINSFSTPTSLKSKFNYLNQLSNSLRLKRREKYSLHDLILKEKKEIFNMLAKDPNFKEETHKLIPINKSPDFYSKIFVNAVKNGNYLLNIIEDIQAKKNRIKTPLTQRQENKNTNIEIIKRKKLNWENKYKLLQKQLIKKSNSFLNKSIKFNESLDKQEEKKKYNSNSRNFKYYKMKPIKNIKQNSKFISMKSQEKKINNLKNLLFKCEIGLNEGENIGNEFEKLHKIIHENNKKISSEENSLNINMFKLLEQKKKRRIDESISFDKYRILEEKKMDEFKKDLIFKVSDMLAYSNRNEYNKKIKGKFSIKAFDLYLDDLGTINKKISLNRKIEKNNMNHLNNLLDDFQVGKALLDKKLNVLNEKHDKYKDIKGECNIDFKDNDEDDIIKENKKSRKNLNHLKIKNDITFYSRFKYFY